MNTPVKVLIVDDHPFFRQGVRFFIESLDNIIIAGEAENGDQALQITDRLDVDVVLMDLEMPGMDGIKTTEALLQANPDLRILILTSFGSEEKIHEAIVAGAAGYCLKDAPPDELITAIKAVAAGGTYLGRGITPKLLAYTSRQKKNNSEENSARSGQSGKHILSDLTQREMDVLENLALGLGNKEIARTLFVSEKTVKTHISNIFQKLHVSTRTQAALIFSEYKMNGSDVK